MPSGFLLHMHAGFEAGEGLYRTDKEGENVSQTAAEESPDLQAAEAMRS
jgi:hypothetical protein